MAEVLGSYQAHGTHTKFAAVLKDVTTSHAATTTTITVTCTGRHYNNDTHANTVSVESLYGKVTHSGLGSVSPASNVYYPSAVVSVAAGKGKTADGNTLTYTITVPRKASEQTVSNISFILTSTVSDKYSTAVWGSSITVPAATISFSAQNLGNKRFSTSSQTVSFTGASGGSGSYAYTKTSEKNSSNTTTNYFSLSGHTLTIAASTPVSTYKIGIKAQDNTTGATNSAIITVAIIKADGGTVTFNDQNFTKTFSTSAQTMTLSAASGGVGTITYAIQSQKNASGTAVSNFTLSGTTLTMAANTGPNTYTIVVRATAPGNSNYNSSIKDATIKVTVNKANISPTVTMVNWAYGGTPSNPSVSGNSGNGTVTYNYKLKSAADSAYSTTKPSDAGTYTIRASIAATTNYNAGTATKDFSITFTATPAAYSAQYNEAAHSASIKTSAPGTTVSYGTSTSYGYSVTCTNANTNYAMSSVTRTVTGTTTVYYSATKNGYTVTGSTTITISNGTLNITPTAYNAIYNGVAHSASIKCTNTGSVTISYGTSTSYGQTLTATTKGTNYSMANVTRTVPGTTTVYYKASKTYYNDVTGSTTIKITGVPVHTNVSGTWKHGAVYLNINGTWKPATAGYVNVNGTWKSINK